MSILFNHFAASASGIGALGFSWSSFVIQLITFLIAYLVLSRYAFKPIMKIMRERRDLIERGVKLGEEMKKEKNELEKKVEQELSSARAKADSILSSAHDAAKEAARSAESSAQQKAESILKEAESLASEEMGRAKRKLEGELSQLVAEATEVLTKEKIGSPKDKELIQKSLKEQAQV